MYNFDYKNMTPFKWFVLENFPFIENDFDAINNYHLFSKVVEYLNKTIDNVNVLGNLVEQFSNYFDNLDVQEEINNKLDEMAEDGTLFNLIEHYVNPYIIEQNNKINLIDQELRSLSSGSPKGVYDTVELLISANPETGVYIVSSNGHIYSWIKDGTEAIDLGIYQASEDSQTVLNINTNLNNLITSERIDEEQWNMLNFSGWPTASNNIYMYKNPVLKGNFIKSLEVITSPDYHNNGSVYLLKKVSETQYSKIKEFNNITSNIIDINYMCDDNIFIALAGEYITNITQQSGYEPLIELNNDFSFNSEASGFSLVSKLSIKNIITSNLDEFFTVGTNCRYSSIQEAINDLPENSIILVKNGIYREGIDARTKNMTIIGESKENCIIEFTNKTYGDSPVYIGIGIWKNLTFKMLKNPNLESYERIRDLTPSQCAYAVHIDHFGSDREIIFENCDFYSELNRAVGIGLKRNVTLKFVRCNMITTDNISPLGCHDCEYDYYGDNQILELDSCNIIAKGCQYAFHTEDRGHTAQGNKMYYRFYRNMFYSEINGKNNIIEIIGATGSGWLGTSVVTLTGDSFGNNLQEMNN